MKTWLKWVCALALVCALGVAASACGGSDGDSGDGGASAGATTAPRPEEIRGKLVVWDVFYKGFPDYTRAVPLLDRAFEEKYPGVTVEHVAQPFDEYPALVRAAFTGREGPDVMMITAYSGVRQYRDGLERLDDRITPEMREQITGWESVTPDFQGERDFYGVPIAETDFIFYYNKELFRRAGLPTDFQPRTWEELRDAGLRLKEAGIQPFTGGNEEGYESQWWWHLAWPTVNTRDDALALVNGELPLTDPKVAAAFGPERMMHDAGLFEEDRLTTPFFNEGYGRFADGRGAMLVGGATVVAYWGEFVRTLGEDKLGVFLPPGSKYVSMQPEWAWAIPKFAKNKDAAWAYLEFMSSREGITMLFEEAGELPNRKDVELPADTPVQARQVRDNFHRLETFAATDVLMPSQVMRTLNTQAKEWLQDRISLEDLQKAMQDTFDKVDRR